MTAIVKHADLPRVDPKPPCGKCGFVLPDVMRTALAGQLVWRCAACSRPEPGTVRKELLKSLPNLADQQHRGDVSDSHVCLVLMDLRPDLSLWTRLNLWEDVVEAATLRREVADGYYHPRDLGFEDDEELDAHVAQDIKDAVDALLDTPADTITPRTTKDAA